MTVPNTHDRALPEPSIEPALLLDSAVNLIDLARNDLNVALRALSNAPLFAVVDLVTALGHLRRAAVLADKVADTIITEAA